MGGSDVLRLVERHLLGWLGPDSGRASLTFLGADPIEVLRFGPGSDGVVRYVTLGMAREPMTPAEASVRDPGGPRAELVLSLRGRRDSAARALAILASMPVVEGRPVVAGSGLDLGEPLWEGGRFTAVLVGEPSGLIPDLPLTRGDLPGLAGGEVGISAPGGPGNSGPGNSGPAIGGPADGGPGNGGPAGGGEDGAGDGPAPVQFLPLLPMTANEAAYKRVHGATAMRQRWLEAGTDLRDPDRPEVALN